MSVAPSNPAANHAAMAAAPLAQNRFNVQQSLAAQLGGNINETHVASPLDELLALKSLRDLGGSKEDMELWQSYVDDSTRMLRIAAYAIKTNPAIQEKLGVGGFKGVMALAALYKQRHSNKVSDEIMDDAILNSPAHIKLENTHDRVIRLNGGLIQRNALRQRAVCALFQ